jgi:uncharacterized protein YggE
MTRSTFALIGVLAVLVAGTVGAVGLGLATDGSPDAAPGQSTVSVSATGTATAEPDQAEVRVVVTATGNDTSDVRSALATKADALRDELDALGVDYETQHYGIGEIHDRGRDRTSDDSDADYRGIHAFAVTIDDIDRVGTVIDGAADVGAEIHGVHLTLSDEKRADLRDDAIENAMDDARSQADTIASASDLTITTVATVDASMDRYTPVAYETAAASDGATPETNIDAGDVSVTYTVSVTYNATA